MTRSLFRRDFTVFRAAVLSVLMIAAALMGEVPQAQTAGMEASPLKAIAEEQKEGSWLLPAVIHVFGVTCDDDNTGVDL